MLSGAIDLLVDEGGGRALVADWKTHALGPGDSAAAVADEYRLQQALYGLAALRAGWEEVTLAWAVLEDLPGSPARIVGAEDAAALEAEVAAALAPLAPRGPAARRRDPPAVLHRLPGPRRGVPGRGARVTPGGPSGRSRAGSTMPKL